jgi:two-component system, OmpR family, heavy metal sensor histidine kinase CusS
MSFASIRRRGRTLRVRLVVWNAAVIVLTASVTVLGLRAGVQWALRHEIDRVLLEDIAEIEYSLVDAHASADRVLAAPSGAADESTQELLAGLERKARGHEQHGWFVRLFDESHRALWASDNAPASVTALDGATNAEPASAASYRVVQRSHTAGGGSPIIIQVGASTLLLERDMARIDRLVGIAVSVVLVSGPLIGYLLADRAIRPLADIIHTTSRLRPARLDERLPETKTGDELDQLAHTINGFLNRIAAYLAQRRDFVANAAHELRTPLAAIRSTAEVALGAERNKEEYQELLVEVIEECTLLEILVNQLLLLAEAEGDRLRIHGERVDLSAVTARAATMFQAAAEAREVRFTTEIAPGLIVEGHAHHLRQVVNNLLDNAIKYTPAGRGVSVRLLTAEAEVLLIVRDTGVGIPAPDVDRVFDRFFRVDRSRSHDVESRGTGLGLSICRAIVDAHGGRISVETALGEGSTFTVALPLASGSRTEPRPTSAMREEPVAAASDAAAASRGGPCQPATRNG